VTVSHCTVEYPVALASRSVDPIGQQGKRDHQPSELLRPPLEAWRNCRSGGFPKGIVNVVPGLARNGMALCADRQIDGIVFTGRQRRFQVLETAAKNVTPVIIGARRQNPHMCSRRRVPRAIKSVQDGIFTNAWPMCWAGQGLHSREASTIISSGTSLESQDHETRPGIAESTSMVH